MHYRSFMHKTLNFEKFPFTSNCEYDVIQAKECSKYTRVHVTLKDSTLRSKSQCSPGIQQKGRTYSQTLQMNLANHAKKSY